MAASDYRFYAFAPVTIGRDMNQGSRRHLHLVSIRYIDKVHLSRPKWISKHRYIMLVRLVVEDTALVYATGPADELESHTDKTAA